MQEERIISLQQYQETEDFRSGKIVSGPLHQNNGRSTVYKKQRWARVILYLGLSATLGLMSYLAFFQKAPALVNEKSQADKPSKKEIHSLSGAEYFALGFANQWLSGDIQGAQSYTADGFMIPESAVKVDKEVKVSTVLPSYVDHIEKNRYRVIVKAFMEKKKQSYLVYLSVPLIVEDGGRFGVYDFPSYIPHPEKPTVPNDEQKKDEIADIPSGVRDTVDSFFRMLTQGKDYDLGSLFMDGKIELLFPVDLMDWRN